MHACFSVCVCVCSKWCIIQHALPRLAELSSSVRQKGWHCTGITRGCKGRVEIKNGQHAQREHAAESAYPVHHTSHFIPCFVLIIQIPPFLFGLDLFKHLQSVLPPSDLWNLVKVMNFSLAQLIMSCSSRSVVAFGPLFFSFLFRLCLCDWVKISWFQISGHFELCKWVLQ